MENSKPRSGSPGQRLTNGKTDVLQRYPEPGTPAKKKEEFRNYDDPAHDSVREFYRLNHKYQTYDNVLAKKANFLQIRQEGYALVGCYGIP